MGLPVALSLNELSLFLLLLVDELFLLVTLGYLLPGEFGAEHFLDFELLFYFYSFDGFFFHFDHGGLGLLAACSLVFVRAFGGGGSEFGVC